MLILKYVVLKYVKRNVLFDVNLNFSYFDILDSKYKVVKFHGKEESYVDNVRVCGSFNLNAPKNACISYRVPVSIIHSLRTKYFVIWFK